MMKTLALEEMEKVTGGHISWLHKWKLIDGTFIGQMSDWTLKYTQDMFCDNKEERDYMKSIWYI